MRNDNLTAEEARDRSALLRVGSYDVHVDLTHAADPERLAYPVRAAVRFEVLAADPAAQTTFIEYLHHSVEAITLNGRRLDPRTAVVGSRITLTGLERSNELVVHGFSLYSRSGEGLHRFLDPEDGRTYLYTQYEPADCRRVFPTFEQPDLKASFRFAVTAPRDWVVASNTPVEREEQDPVDESVSKRIFAPTQRISTYITTLLAGQYHAVSSMYQPSADTAVDGVEPKPMTLYCRQALAAHLPARELFELVGAGLDFFQVLFDLAYPFPQYDQAFVPEYNLGAMENPGLVTFTENYLHPGGATEAQREARANVIMHEMSHMWFGDLVTMSWWSDLWLKESFAEFMGALGAERAGGFDQAWVSFAHGRKAWAYRQDAYSTTHPIVADIPDVEAAKQNFDGITYAKGASVLKQLVAHVGFERFIGAARVYFRRHAWGTARLEDFLAALEESCGRDLGAWARQWLQTSGVSVLRQDGSRLIQELPEGVSPELGRAHTLHAGVFDEVDGTLCLREDRALEVPAGREGLDLELPDALDAAESAGLLLLNREDLTYAVTRVAPEQLDTALRAGHTLEAPLDRAVLGSALWTMLRDAQLSPSSYLDYALAGVRAENSATLLETTARHVHEAIEELCAPAQRPQPRSRAAEAFLTALEAAAPESDAQRILLHHVLILARTTEEALPVAEQVHAAWSEDPGAARWGGLELTDELAWSARLALALSGRLTAEDLDVALDARRNRHAEVGWNRARAAVPDAAAKQWAWERIFSGRLSNDELSAAAAGFADGPARLRAAYADRYFAALESVWAEHSIGMASRIVGGLFPDLDAVEDSPQRAGAWLAEHEQAPRALRRLVIEHREDALRVRRVRAACAGV
ncbi:aminopeptidase N [Rothia kristinae]|uniref:aminopeptidase N n=1 Tax=Rothia kristinae TaxID=37923 RepID=UPI003424AE2E